MTKQFKVLFTIWILIGSTFCGGGGTSQSSSDADSFLDGEEEFSSNQFAGSKTFTHTGSFNERSPIWDEQGDLKGSYFAETNFKEVKEGYIFEALLLSESLGDDDYFDPYLVVYDAQSAKIISEDDDEADGYESYLQFTVPKTGEYKAVVFSYDQEVGPWKLKVNIRAPQSSEKEHVLFDPAYQKDDPEQNNDTCYSITCGECYRFDYNSCSCTRKIACSYTSI